MTTASWNDTTAQIKRGGLSSAGGGSVFVQLQVAPLRVPGGVPHRPRAAFGDDDIIRLILTLCLCVCADPDDTICPLKTLTPTLNQAKTEGLWSYFQPRLNV